MTWQDKYKLAKAYYEHYGNLEIPQNYKTFNGYEKDENGLNLGLWIVHQRQTYKGNSTYKISEERIKLLEEIKMIWNVYDTNWNEMYKLAKAYYEHYGNLEIPQNYKTFNGYEEDKEGFNLGCWINAQRNAFKGIGTSKITKKQIKQLDEIKMVWNVYDTNWNEMYKLAKIYYEHYGNLEISFDYKTINGYERDKEGFNLGCWIHTQRQAFKGTGTSKITKKQIKQLDEIKMVWNVYDTNWNEMYKLAKAYYKYYGNLEIPFDYKTINGYESDKEGFNLGYWINTQRRTYKGDSTRKIAEEQIRLLDEIGMIWYFRDEKLQKEIITSSNLKKKNIEILNRTRTLLNQFASDTLPTKEELNESFIKKLELK